MYLAGDQEFARVRKILRYAFSPEALRNQEPILQKHIQTLMQGLNHEGFKNKGIVDLNNGTPGSLSI